MQIVEAVWLLSLWSQYNETDVVKKPTGEELVVQWHTFKSTNTRVYTDSAEEQRRMQIYMENTVKCDEHNRKADNGEVSFRVEMNQFGDMEHSEFLQYTGMEGNCKLREERLRALVNSTGTCADPQPFDANYIRWMGAANVILPKAIDWRDLKAVTPVKEQGQCGSCWAFSAIGALEGLHFRRTGKLVRLSEQQLVDCSTSKFNCNGCVSGWPCDAMRYARDVGGIMPEELYPYSAKQGVCATKVINSTLLARDVAIAKCPCGNERLLRNAVATMGPISVACDASQWSFRMYRKGVYFEPQCDPKKLDHAVLVVGYGEEEDGTKYWWVKNSWGVRWGDKGYMKLARDRDNHCGVASAATFALN